MPWLPLARGEGAEMPVHQMRDIELGNAENAGDFALRQLFVLQDFEDMKADLRARQEPAGVFQPEIGKHVAGAFLKLNAFPFFAFIAKTHSRHMHRRRVVPAPVRPYEDFDILIQLHKEPQQPFNRKLPEFAAQHLGYVRLSNAK
jgi:hypothetical protein